MAKNKFSKRTAAPKPTQGLSRAESLGCLSLLAVPTTLAVAAFRAGRFIAAALLASLVVPFIAYWIWGRLLVVFALLRWRAQGITGILVLSDSPVWRPYIDRTWRPVLSKKLVMLNWSERARWRNSLEVLLWRHFVGHDAFGGIYRNYCPAVVVLRGLRHPLVFRLYGAFQDAKHGNDTQLRILEEGIFRAVGMRGESGSASR